MEAGRAKPLARTSGPLPLASQYGTTVLRQGNAGAAARAFRMVLTGARMLIVWGMRDIAFRKKDGRFRSLP
jgi:hypothetical protein